MLRLRISGLCPRAVHNWPEQPRTTGAPVTYSVGIRIKSTSVEPLAHLKYFSRLNERQNYSDRLTHSLNVNCHAVLCRTMYIIHEPRLRRCIGTLYARISAQKLAVADNQYFSDRRIHAGGGGHMGSGPLVFVRTVT